MHDPTAVLAGAGADVDDPVGGPDGVLVVLDDDERVAQVPQPGQGVDQPAVVALVQADARLVQDVEHADQAGADLRRQPDALRLAAGQRRGRARQREVVEADVEQEAEPRLDLLEHLGGDRPLALTELEAVEELARLPDGQAADLGDRVAADAHREHLGLEPAPSHTGHGTSRMKASYFSLLQSESVSVCRRSRNVMTPSNPVEYWRSRPQRFL